ncbi:MAG: N-acetyl-gamma-glutamyl-phosphate reductase [Clostridiales Family XIII bacterium]|nr:N-acetyl-gamma-glutamyl-phosphate reductase [Clostridiales Family XIII bacterium]
MAYKIFIDGQAGTTGLRLAGRLKARPDVELLEIGGALRKDIETRLACIAEADVSFLCLPDEGAREIARLAGGRARLIDASSAHRTAAGWAYGLPEIAGAGADMGAGALRVANPGCHATGFILSVRPLIDAGLLRADAALGAHSLTGYSGGGKPMVAEYEAPGRAGGAGDASSCETGSPSSRIRGRGAGGVPGDGLRAPRQYALAQAHKHLPEMQKYAGLATAPIFAPIVCDFYSGMLVGVPIPKSALAKPATIGDVRETLAGRYGGRPLVKVRELGAEFAEAAGSGFLAADAFANRDDLEIFVTGKDDRIEIVARYDNLGKGASGAAIQNMNRMLGLPEETGLVLGE